MNKWKRVNFVVFIFALQLSLGAQAGLLYVYNRLATKDLEQMNKIIKDKIKESQKSGGDKTIPLKEALQAVYSRPNEDFLIEKIIAPVKSELDEHKAWERSIQALVKEAIGALKNPKAFRPDAQVTYVIFLENLIAEFRPLAGKDFEKAVLNTIAQAKIELTREAKNERRMKMMKEMESPSVLAENALTTAAATTTTTVPMPE